ncbi:uncharacterized protein EV420DRAFT_311986 [Desarmillaria tabescens]|uniref:Uncharacterized protein n=1 Tax=Armillaria tabescens TaxID=1929756 RepID=A0AA39KDN6_ARMTA|nr:uncharacterized protein EV420DRAFT_311986 [Desarmillaria tabescens]KAK0459261.1 hypothetical protein EV420DRAFT_311986 [Desarmillaria tabescens]
MPPVSKQHIRASILAQFLSIDLFAVGTLTIFFHSIYTPVMQFSRMDIMDEQRFDPTKKTTSTTAPQSVLDEEVDLPLRKKKSTADILDSQRFDPTKKTLQRQADSSSKPSNGSDDLPLSDEFTIIDPLEVQAPAASVDATVIRKALRRVLSFDNPLPPRPFTASSTASSSRPSTAVSTPESILSSLTQTAQDPIEFECEDMNPDRCISTRMIIHRSPSKLSFDALSCCSGSAFEKEVAAEVERAKESKNISVWVNQESSSTEEYFWTSNMRHRNRNSAIQVESRVEAV